MHAIVCIQPNIINPNYSIMANSSIGGAGWCGLIVSNTPEIINSSYLYYSGQFQWEFHGGSRHVPRDPDLPSRSGGGPELPRAPVGAAAEPRVRFRQVSHRGEPSAGSQAACCIKCGWLRRALPDQGMGRLLAD